jgi:hypothetical protein
MRYLLNHHLTDLRAHLDGFLNGQINYHEDNAYKCEKTHHRLHSITHWVFFLALLVVVLHVGEFSIEWLWHEQHNALTDFAHLLASQHWSLLVTAFFPALAAALHGIMSTLELKRMANGSEKMSVQLEQIRYSLEKSPDHPMILRAHALLTAQSVFAEHANWSDIMAAQNLDFPA